jgi:hypothetical protein
MNWQTTYPALATIMVANLDTLQTWAEKLPPPQTDVERTVHRRLIARRDELGRRLLREQNPDIADKLNSLADTVEKLTGSRAFPRF